MNSSYLSLPSKSLPLILPLFLFLACNHSINLTMPNNKTEGIYHTVKKKETLWRISKTYDVSMQEIAELNNIKDPSQIKTGDKIFIPGAKKQRKIPVSEKNNTHYKQKITKKKGLFIWPLKGKLLTRFGVHGGIKYDGIDIAAPVGSIVNASRSGKVVFSAPLKGYGNTIIIQHKNRYATIYANNHINLVKKGQWIRQGQPIARIGASNAKKNIPPHLHFQIRKNNHPRNPLFYLP